VISEVKPPLLTSEFLDTLSILPLPYKASDAKLWNKKLFKPFGTHCMDSITMGARYGRLIQVKKSEKTRGSEMKVTAGVSASYGAFSGGVDTSYGNKNTNSNSNGSYQETSFSIGSQPGQNINEWLSKITTHMPISYELEELDTCIDYKIIKDQMKAHKLNPELVISSIKTAAESYCKDFLLPNNLVKSCEKPVDPVPVKVQVTEIVSGNSYCIKNHHTGKCITFNAYSTPVTVDNCDCSNKNQQVTALFVSSNAEWKLFSNNGSTWDIFEGKKDAGSRIFWYKSMNGGNQFYTLILDRETNTYVIKSNYADKCVEIRDNNMSNGSLIQINHCTNAMSQVWSFQPVK
jgi:hypothetical protein